MTTIVFETHATTLDNEAGIATGWLQGELAPVGIANARALGLRRRDDGLDAVFCSDLFRARQTYEVALGDADIPAFFDWRLRECNYGDLNGHPGHEVHADRSTWIDTPYPNGESWKTAGARVKACIDDIAALYPHGRVLVIGHVATRWSIEHYATGAAYQDLATADFAWQEGWEFRYSVR